MLTFQIKRFDHGVSELHTICSWLLGNLRSHEVQIEIIVKDRSCIWQNIVQYVVDQACEL